MTRDQVLARPAKILSDKQRRDYFDKGYVMAASVVPRAWVDRLLNVTASFVEKSKNVAKSDKVFDLDAGHSAERPKLRRLSSSSRSRRDLLGVRLQRLDGRYR